VWREEIEALCAEGSDAVAVVMAGLEGRIEELERRIGRGAPRDVGEPRGDHLDRWERLIQELDARLEGQDVALGTRLPMPASCPSEASASASLRTVRGASSRALGIGARK
jgi:hypothetical protein